MNDFKSVPARWGEPIWMPGELPVEVHVEGTPAVLVIAAVVERYGVDLVAVDRGGSRRGRDRQLLTRRNATHSRSDGN